MGVSSFSGNRRFLLSANKESINQTAISAIIVNSFLFSYDTLLKTVTNAATRNEVGENGRDFFSIISIVGIADGQGVPYNSNFFNGSLP